MSPPSRTTVQGFLGGQANPTRNWTWINYVCQKYFEPNRKEVGSNKHKRNYTSVHHSQECSAGQHSSSLYWYLKFTYSSWWCRVRSTSKKLRFHSINEQHTINVDPQHIDWTLERSTPKPGTNWCNYSQEITSHNMWKKENVKMWKRIHVFCLTTCETERGCVSRHIITTSEEPNFDVMRVELDIQTFEQLIVGTNAASRFEIYETKSTILVEDTSPKP